MKVAVIGLGYVGLPLALLLKEKDYDVVGVDINKKSVDLINSGQSPVLEEGLDDKLKLHPINATTEIQDVSDVNVFIICVPTPVKNSIEPDLGPVISASKSVASTLSKGDLVIVESTVNPGVCEETVIPVLEKGSGLDSSQFDVAHCPERINPGDLKWSVSNINRVVGASSTKALDRAVEFYESIIDGEIKPMGSLKEAEAVKVVENSFRDVNIAFVNELAKSFSKLGIDVENVIDGAATKPFAFMPHRPGVGVGGHCIPVDPYYLIEYARGYDFDHEFLSLARRINSGMPEFTISLLEKALSESDLKPHEARVAVLGISYKPNVGDDRESPYFDIVKILDSKEISHKSFDPYIDQSKVKSLDLLLDESNVVLIVTGHDEFLKISPEKYSNEKIRLIVDGRNIYRNKRKAFEKFGISYVGIGIGL